MSLALTVRDRLTERWITTQQRYYKHDTKRVYYLSAEFLLGRALANNLINLGLYETARDAMKMAGIELLKSNLFHDFHEMWPERFKRSPRARS